MTRWLLLAVIIVGIGVLVLYPGERSQTPLPSPIPAKNSGGLGLFENENRLMDLKTDKGDFRVVWEIVDFENVRIGLNQELDYGSQQLMEKNSCVTLTSAAFYDTNEQPLGLLVDQGATLSAWRENQLLHAAVGFEENSQRGIIVKEMADYRWRWAVQAGPIVWQQGEPSVLRLNSDQEARRIIAGITDKAQLILMAMVASDSLYLGPKLADLPAILAVWQNQTGVVLTDAINLDGGTASAFLSPTLKLKELKPIGSYICIE